MTRKANDEPLVRVNLKFFAADWDEWQRIYGPGRASEALRIVMRHHLRTLKPDDEEALDVT